MDSAASTSVSGVHVARKRRISDRRLIELALDEDEEESLMVVAMLMGFCFGLKQLSSRNEKTFGKIRLLITPRFIHTRDQIWQCTRWGTVPTCTLLVFGFEGCC